jgi:hypothetical protein
MATQTNSIDFDKLLKSIINQRSFLIKNGSNRKCIVTCNKNIKFLKTHTEAYRSKWDVSGWKKFIIRNYSLIDYLIPNSKAGETTRNKIKLLIQ